MQVSVKSVTATNINSCVIKQPQGLLWGDVITPESELHTLLSVLRKTFLTVFMFSVMFELTITAFSFTATPTRDCLAS